MSEERLSKLQKWILMKSLESESVLSRKEIYHKYFGLNREDRTYPCYEKDENGRPIIWRRSAAYVSVSRSLKNLREKGLIDNKYYGAHLTDKGKEKALMLHPWDLTIRKAR